MTLKSESSQIRNRDQAFKINNTPHTGSDLKTSEKDQAKSEIIVSVISNDPPCKNAKIVISDSQKYS